MTKHNYLVRDADELPRVVAEAFHIARTGRPGPGPHRHHQGRAPAGDPRRAPDRGRGRRRAPGLPAEPRWPRPPAQDGRDGDRERQAPGHPRRPRRPARRGVGRPAGLRREDLDPGGLDAARHRGDGRDASARLRLHGHARLEARQPRDPERRPAHRHRHALRRPGDRQRPDLRALCPDHPRRHRPGRDRQERGGRGADRRRCGARPSRADPDGPRDHRGRAARVPRPAGRLASATRRRRRGTAPGAWRDGAAVRRLRRRAHRRADRSPGDLRRRRRAEPDVAGPLHRLPQPELARLVGRPRHDGLLGPGRHGRGARPARTARPGRSPATAGSR